MTRVGARGPSALRFGRERAALRDDLLDNASDATASRCALALRTTRPGRSQPPTLCRPAFSRVSHSLTGLRRRAERHGRTDGARVGWNLIVLGAQRERARLSHQSGVVVTLGSSRPPSESARAVHVILFSSRSRPLPRFTFTTTLRGRPGRDRMVASRSSRQHCRWAVGYWTPRPMSSSCTPPPLAEGPTAKPEPGSHLLPSWQW